MKFFILYILILFSIIIYIAHGCNSNSQKRVYNGIQTSKDCKINRYQINSGYLMNKRINFDGRNYKRVHQMLLEKKLVYVFLERELSHISFKTGCFLQKIIDTANNVYYTGLDTCLANEEEEKRLYGRF